MIEIYSKIIGWFGKLILWVASKLCGTPYEPALVDLAVILLQGDVRKRYHYIRKRYQNFKLTDKIVILPGTPKTKEAQKILAEFDKDFDLLMKRMTQMELSQFEVEEEEVF